MERLNFSYAFPVTPSDTDPLPVVCDALYVGGAGDVTVQMQPDATSPSAPVTFTAVPVGTVLPIRTAQVMATGTAATNLVALWGR